MAYVGNMGASGAFGAVADFIRNRRGFKQETEDRDLQRQMAELQREALKASTAGTVQRTGFEAELQPVVKEGAELGVNNQRDTLAHNRNIRPHEVTAAAQGVQKGAQDVTQGAIRTSALERVAARPDADYFDDPSAIVNANIAGMDPRTMVPGARQVEATKDLGRFTSGLRIGEARVGSGLRQAEDANRLALEQNLQGMPRATSDYLSRTYNQLQENVWKPYRALQQGLEDDKRYYTQMAANGMGGAEQVKLDLGARQTQLAADHAAAQASAEIVVKQAEQAILGYHQPGTPEYQRAMDALQQMRLGASAPAAAISPKGPPEF